MFKYLKGKMRPSKPLEVDPSQFYLSRDTPPTFTLREANDDWAGYLKIWLNSKGVNIHGAYVRADHIKIYVFGLPERIYPGDMLVASSPGHISYVHGNPALWRKKER
jgi:hypothetical protein